MTEIDLEELIKAEIKKYIHEHLVRYVDEVSFQIKDVASEAERYLSKMKDKIKYIDGLVSGHAVGVQNVYNKFLKFEKDIEEIKQYFKISKLNKKFVDKIGKLKELLD